MTQSLLDQVREAHQLAVDGKLLRNTAEEILAAVRAYFEAQEEAGLDPDAGRRKQVATALKTLSYSENLAMVQIADVIRGDDNPKGTLLVASKVADAVGVTRSVLVNALRKLESAGVIQSRSLGMKGTHIKVLMPEVLDELAGSKPAA